MLVLLTGGGCKEDLRSKVNCALQKGTEATKPKAKPPAKKGSKRTAKPIEDVQQVSDEDGDEDIGDGEFSDSQPSRKAAKHT